MKIKKNHKLTKYHPSTHLYHIFIIALVAIGISTVIFFVYWVSISKTTTNIIINPAKEGISFMYDVFPKEILVEVWEQQQIIWSLLMKGFQELVRSFSSF